MNSIQAQMDTSSPLDQPLHLHVDEGEVKPNVAERRSGGGRVTKASNATLAGRGQSRNLVLLRVVGS